MRAAPIGAALKIITKIGLKKFPIAHKFLRCRAGFSRRMGLPPCRFPLARGLVCPLPQGFARPKAGAGRRFGACLRNCTGDLCLLWAPGGAPHVAISDTGTALFVSRPLVAGSPSASSSRAVLMPPGGDPEPPGTAGPLGPPARGATPPPRGPMRYRARPIGRRRCECSPTFLKSQASNALVSGIRSIWLLSWAAMHPLVSSVLQFFGVPAIVVGVAIIADFAFQSEGRRRVVQWIAKNATLELSRKHFGELVDLILEKVVYRIFGPQIISLSFFGRSCVATLLLLAIGLALQTIYYPDQSHFQLAIFETGFNHTLWYLLVLLGVNFVIDYFSNIKTLMLLRLAAETRRLRSTIIIFFADIALTFTLFTFLFPVSIVACVLIYEASNPPIRIEITKAPEVADVAALYLLDHEILELSRIRQAQLEAFKYSS